MAERNSSSTARGVALLRAAHQIIDAAPPVLRDPVIARLLDPGSEDLIRANAERFQAPEVRGLRSHVVLRSRVAEDRLAEALEHGAMQYIILGAGLDTFAYRQPSWARELAIIEVDHPASQAAKRGALAVAGIEVPANVRYADVDFEHETLAAGLDRCGVSTETVTFFSWLGVTMYLTREAIDAVLDTVTGFPRGSEIVLTFARPAGPDDHNRRMLAEGAANAGEPWISYFTTQEVEALLRVHGFRGVWFLTRDEAMRRYYADRSDGLAPPRHVSIVAATV